MTTIKFGRKKTKVFLLLGIGLISVALVSAVWVRTNGRYLEEFQQQGQPIMLDVPPLAQSQATSCGEAVIVMAYKLHSCRESP